MYPGLKLKEPTHFQHISNFNVGYLLNKKWCQKFIIGIEFCIVDDHPDQIWSNFSQRCWKSRILGKGLSMTTIFKVRPSQLLPVAPMTVSLTFSKANGKSFTEEYSSPLPPPPPPPPQCIGFDLWQNVQKFVVTTQNRVYPLSFLAFIMLLATCLETTDIRIFFI